MAHDHLAAVAELAAAAARAGGAVLREGYGQVHSVRFKGEVDLVTEVDVRSERTVVDLIRARFPRHQILAEEGTTGGDDPAHRWIIDPLDGTTNFLHGFPVYAVSIALAHRGQVQQAVVYDPTRNDLFFASKGRGAFLNDRRLRVSKRTRLADSLIGTGFPFRKGDNFKRYVKMFEEVMQSCSGLRRPGAAALDLCYVAAGYYDGFFETGLSPWDIAAGSLMITEAGGLIGNFTGESDYLYQREVVAGNPKVYGQLVQILAPYTRVIRDGDEGGLNTQPAPGSAPDEATAAFAASAGRQDGPGAETAADADGNAAPVRKPVRIRKATAGPRE
jgi:myo-inositol-1(or 4)-monophosphatase